MFELAAGHLGCVSFAPRRNDRADLRPILTGLVGPRRLYSEGGMYHPAVFGFLLGAVLPVIPYLLARKYPTSSWKYVREVIFVTHSPHISPLSPGQYPGLLQRGPRPGAERSELLDDPVRVFAYHYRREG